MNTPTSNQCISSTPPLLTPTPHPNITFNNTFNNGKGSHLVCISLITGHMEKHFAYWPTVLLILWNTCSCPLPMVFGTWRFMTSVPSIVTIFIMSNPLCLPQRFSPELLSSLHWYCNLFSFCLYLWDVFLLLLLLFIILSYSVLNMSVDSMWVESVCSFFFF